jgi:hypothetical protein
VPSSMSPIIPRFPAVCTIMVRGHNSRHLAAKRSSHR